MIATVEPDADGEAVATFPVPTSQGLTLQEFRDLLSQELHY